MLEMIEPVKVTTYVVLAVLLAAWLLAWSGMRPVLARRAVIGALVLAVAASSALAAYQWQVHAIASPMLPDIEREPREPVHVPSLDLSRIGAPTTDEDRLSMIPQTNANLFTQLSLNPSFEDLDQVKIVALIQYERKAYGAVLEGDGRRAFVTVGSTINEMTVTHIGPDGIVLDETTMLTQFAPDTLFVKSSPEHTWIFRGHEGEAVLAIQEALAKLGHYEETPTGVFDAATEEAVRAFQEAVGLAPTGIVDQETWQLLLGEDDRFER